ncbi:MAG: hypothetical protein WCW87_04095 [Candidatus Paceibacterota bacterium]
MTDDKIRELIDLYRGELSIFPQVMVPKQMAHNNLPPSSKWDILSHTRFMLDEMEIFLNDGEKEKVIMLLGFVQGCLWSLGVYTIVELERHNKFSKEQEKPNLLRRMKTILVG